MDQLDRARQHNPASREQVAAILRQRFERAGVRVAEYEQEAPELPGVERRGRGRGRGVIPPPGAAVGGFNGIPGQLPPPPIPAPPIALGAGAPAGFPPAPFLRPPVLVPGQERPAYLVRPRPPPLVAGGVIRGPLHPPPDLPPLPPPRVLMMEDVWAPRLGAGAGNRGPPFYRQASVSSSSPPEDDDGLDGGQPRTCNVSVEGDVICYSSGDADRAIPGGLGFFLGHRPLSSTRPFFEVEILDRGNASDPPGIVVGLCSKRHPVDLLPGWNSESVGLLVGDGTIFRGRPPGQAYGPCCDVGDKVGCGIRIVHKTASIFFTRNGRELAPGGAPVTLPVPPGGLFPAVALCHPGEEVALRQGLAWSPEEDMMLVDGGEDEWVRLHDVQLNGQVLEYVGKGKSLVDVGMAQARTPICTRNHYFEIEIVDPGASCYIAIGLARRDYPKNRHPGWNKGSIAYHADDGKVFVGSGVGAPFGPRCHKGDVMGCGVLFPRNYECKSDSEEELEQQAGEKGREGAMVGRQVLPGDPLGAAAAMVDVGDHDYVQVDEFGSDSADDDDDDDDDEWWHDRILVQSGVRVQIYFTRNGKVIGKKDVRIPKGGFYPTIGMMSCQEKVRVDLRPLSG